MKMKYPCQNYRQDNNTAEEVQTNIPNMSTAINVSQFLVATDISLAPSGANFDDKSSFQDDWSDVSDEEEAW